jgi:hypothetical protein
LAGETRGGETAQSKESQQKIPLKRRGQTVDKGYETQTIALRISCKKISEIQAE